MCKYNISFSARSRMKNKVYAVYVSSPSLFGSLSSGGKRSSGSLGHTGFRHALEYFLDLGRAASEGMAPELVALILDQFDEGDHQAPRVGTVNNKPLEQHACDLLLDTLILGIAEKEEHNARVVVRVAGGVTELVGNGVQGHVATKVVKLHQRLKDLHLGGLSQRVSNLGVVQTLDGTHTDVKNERIDPRRIDDVGTLLVKTRKKGREEILLLLTSAQEVVEIRLHRSQGASNVGKDGRALRDLRKQVNLQVGREGIGEFHTAGVRR
mmetsp:Transcript_17518/g.50122  ORF Transcript_17518/g.50122 Transcript_17518/m.50122 type:complete len:267 (-) Transcript_17518:5867-6667(-)